MKGSPGSIESLSPERSKKQRKVEQKKKETKKALLELASNKNDASQPGRFYNKYQNIQKIIDIENKEIEEDLKEASGEKVTVKVSHKNNQSRNSIASDENVKDSGKSPMVEYLKQVHKDNLLPHFLPFKKLAEAEADFHDTGEVASAFLYSLD